MLTAAKELISAIDAQAENRKKQILLSPCSVIPAKASYYISADGNDLFDGRSENTPIRTFDALKALPLQPGDAVFFRRGDLWRIPGGYTVPAGVTLSAYGVGEKPVLTASPENAAYPDAWRLMEGTDNIWIYHEAIRDVGTLDLGDGVFAYKMIPSYRDGRFVLREDPLSPFDVREQLSSACDLAFFQKNDTVLSSRGLPDISSSNTGLLYFRCDRGNPGKVFSSIEFLYGRNLLSVGGTSVTIDNLCLRHCGAHGVGSGNNLELTVQNCEIGPLGGAIQFYSENGSVTRFGNGVEIYGGCRDYTVRNCYIHDIYDAGVTHQRKGPFANQHITLTSAYETPDKPAQTFTMDGAIVMENVSYLGNLFERCIYSIEYFCDQSDGDDDIMRHIRMEDNICRFAGGWGWQRPNKAARHIQGGWLNCERKYPAEDFIIRNNIFDRSIDVLVSVSSTKDSDLPKMENNTYIQYADGRYGMYGVPYDKYYPFNETTELNVIRSASGQNEPYARVYCIPEESL